jgi:ATP-binding cassette subfamily F protein 3
MLQVSDLSKSYGQQLLFEDVRFAIEPGERVGLVGRNGHGKSTLLKLLCGQEEADSGVLHHSAEYKLGYLSQHIEFTEATVRKEGCLGLPIREDGWQESHKVDAVLSGLGFSEEQFSLPPSALSGGFQVRLHLAKLLVSDANLLMLDEPTNYLDIVSLRWLAQFLLRWNGEILLITHDRSFMDSVITHTLGIHRRSVRKVAGPTKNLYTQLELEEEVHEKTRLNQEKQRKKTEDFVRRFRAKASKAKAVQSRVKALEKDPKLEKLEDVEQLDFRFSHAPFQGKWLLHARDLSFGYGKESNLFENLSFSVGQKDRIGIIGKNGKGKSTLLRVLAEELKARTGEVEYSANASFSYFGQTNVERLDTKSTIEEELLRVTDSGNRTRARSVAGLMLFEGDLAKKKIQVLSGGEKSRVLLGKILLQPSNLLMLDEPDNHLDMESTDAMLEAIKIYPGSLLLVTHSEMLLREVVNRLIIFDGQSAQIFEGGYEDFLERVGWNDEDSPKKREGAEKKVISKKEARKLRAQVIQERSALISPLKKKADKLEKSLGVMEDEAKSLNEQLIEASKEGFGDDAAKISRELHNTRKKIDDAYSELETTLEQIDLKSEEFSKRLEELS